MVIDVEKGTPMAEVRRKLAAATGVPPQHQKIMLSGIDQLVMGDKRTNVGFAHCGTASSLYFVAATAAESAAGK